MRKVIRNILNVIIIILFLLYIVIAFVDVLSGMKLSIAIICFLLVRFFIFRDENE